MLRRSPQRSCIGCRTVRDKGALVRVVHTPDGRFVLDSRGKMAGRGAYLCPSVDCLRAAIKRKSFDRAFRETLPGEAAAALQVEIQNYLEARVEAAARSDERSHTASSDESEASGTGEAEKMEL